MWEGRKMLEKYVAFYTSTHFWVDGIPDLKTIQHDPDRYHKAMAEVVFAHSTKDYTLKVCKDGLFMVRIEPLEIELGKGQHEENIRSLCANIEETTLPKSLE
jgi:hypothetical protein